jgi:hypothetical protein
MIDNILFLNRIYTPAIPKEPYTCDRNPDSSAATGDSADAAQPSGSAAPTVPRSAGSTPGGR